MGGAHHEPARGERLGDVEHVEARAEEAAARGGRVGREVAAVSGVEGGR